jgi:DNA-binding transcriptional LysR family regulator
MPRFDSNRAAEMEVFVRIVDLGGFGAAARHLGLTPSAVSKLVTRLEARLNARLLNRSTRRLQLTPEGRGFYERAVRILGDLDEAEREAAAGACPSGHLSVNCNVPVGMRHVAPLIPEFLALYPEVTVDLVLSDTVVDLMAARADVAIRVGPLEGAGLVARKLGTSRMVVVGAPDYLARWGAPRMPAELAGHRRIGWTFSRLIGDWPFQTEGGLQRISPPAVVRASDGEAARLLALGGAGLARLARFHVDPDIQAGRLVPVLEMLNPGDREDVHAVYLGARGPLPARVRAFIDFLAERVRIEGGGEAGRARRGA